jgi:dephospho-CoA kinase
MTQQVSTAALVGGIGSGKSTVLDMFAQLGAYVIRLDDIGHDVLHEPDVIAQLVATFGPGVLDDAGEVVRARLAQAAFDTAEHTRALNDITHPSIMDEMYRQVDIAHTAHKVAVVEVTSGEVSHEALPWADVIIAVSAPEELRVKRACGRKGATEEDVRQRIARQPSDEQREAVADYVIVNATTVEEARRQVVNVWRSMTAPQQPSIRPLGAVLGKGRNK